MYSVHFMILFCIATHSSCVYKAVSEEKLQAQFAHIGPPDETSRSADAFLIFLLPADLISVPSCAGNFTGHLEKYLAIR